MTMEIKIELNEHDIAHFRTLFDEARRKSGEIDAQKVLDKARESLQSTLEDGPPEFIRRRLEGLKQLVAMVEDEAWALPEEERNRALAVLAYFVDSEDVIPDAIPVLGMLDDAIAAELALQALQHELDAYEEFSTFRSAEAQRRANTGRSTDVTKEDWLADKRAVLHSRMREHRLADPQLWHNMMFNY